MLGSLCTLISGPFGSTVTTNDYDPSSRTRYIRGKDVQPFFVEDDDKVFIRSDLFEQLHQFHLRQHDLLLTVVGMKFGKVAIIHSEDLPAVFSCKSTLLRDPKINVYYLLAYLSSQIGHDLIRRGERGAAQPGINLFDIRNIPIPLFSASFRTKIEQATASSYCLANSLSMSSNLTVSRPRYSKV